MHLSKSIDGKTQEITLRVCSKYTVEKINQTCQILGKIQQTAWIMEFSSKYMKTSIIHH